MNIQQFSNRVFHADCLDVLPRLPAESIDFILTDPPYLVNYRDRQGRKLANDDGEAWLKPAFAAAFRLLKPGGFCVSFYGWPKIDAFMQAWRAAGFRPVGHPVWVKRYHSSAGFLGGRHESAFLLLKGDARKPAEPLPDVLPWFNSGNALHPTQKPVPSLKPLIEAFTRPGDVVLDPFCGSGSTLLAAKILGRRFVGIELDAAFCHQAQRRLTGGA
jgi:adenine-specific DNA-methyltransferase